MKLLSTIAAIGTTVALALSAGPATARENIVITGSQDDALTRTQRVAYSDLDLATQRGERVLNRRVGVAVREVCSHDSEHFFVLRPCMLTAWSDARPQIANALERAKNNPGLAFGGSITVTARR